MATLLCTPLEKVHPTASTCDVLAFVHMLPVPFQRGFSGPEGGTPPLPNLDFAFFSLLKHREKPSQPVLRQFVLPHPAVLSGLHFCYSVVLCSH